MSVTSHLPLLTSLRCSVFCCRCRCCLLFLTQPILVVVGAVKVTGLKNPFNNLLQCFIWENGRRKHQHHLSPHLLLPSSPKIPVAGKMLLPQASLWPLLVQCIFSYWVTFNKSINNPLSFRKIWRVRRILRVDVTVVKHCGALHSEVKFMNLITRLLLLLLKTISVRQFLPKQLPIKINLQRYHLVHEGSSPAMRWLKRASVSKEHLYSVPQLNAGAS